MSVAAYTGVTIAHQLAKLALRLLGFGPLMNFAEPLIRAAGLLFGAPGSVMAGTLVDIVAQLGISTLISGTGVLLLGTGSVLGGFTVKALVFIVKTGASFVYLTVDMAARGTTKVVKYAYNSLPVVSPPPAYWKIEENYMPEKRSSYHPPNINIRQPSLLSNQTIPIDPKEVSKIAGHEELFNSSFIQCTDEQITSILGKSNVVNASALMSPASPSIQIPSSSAAYESYKHPILSPHHSHTQSSPPVSPYRSMDPISGTVPSYPSLDSQYDSALGTSEYTGPTVSGDALAGFLGQSARLMQEAGLDDTANDDELQKVLNGISTEFLPPPGSSPSYAARKLQQSVQYHGSSVRQRDPILDSWMDVSAPPKEE